MKQTYYTNAFTIEYRQIGNIRLNETAINCISLYKTLLVFYVLFCTERYWCDVCEIKISIYRTNKIVAYDGFKKTTESIVLNPS